MNINRELENLILKENRDNHEKDECVLCEANTPVRGGTWIKNSEIGRSGTVGIPVYVDEQSTMVYPMSQSLLIGSTGTGKTTVLVHNIIDYSLELPKDQRPSLCVTDLKGDIYPQFRDRLKKAGYTVLLFDMKHCFQSAQYNPLSDIYDTYQEARKIQQLLDGGMHDHRFGDKVYPSTEEARAAAQVERLRLLERVDDMLQEKATILVPDGSDPKNASWVRGARNCALAILHTMLRDSEKEQCQMTRENFTIANVCRIAFHTQNECHDLITWLRRADDIPVVSSALGSCYDIRAQITRDGYISSLNTELGKFSSLSVNALTATSHAMDWQAIAGGQKPHAIFIHTDDRRPVTNQVCAMLINDLLHTLSEAAEKSPGGALSRDFMFLCDEFANMPKLPSLVGGITTLRSKRIWIMMAVQSLRQLDMVYGEDEREIILDNCDLTFYLGCNHDDTKEFFSKCMGSKAGIERTFSYAINGSMTVNTHTIDVRVVKKSDLTLPLGTFYVKSRSCQNLKTRMIPFFLRTDRYRRSESFTGISLFNGFDPEKNVYDIEKILQMEEEDDPNDTDFSSIERFWRSRK